MLGLQIIAENYREARDSYKLDLALPDGSQIELFSFPGSPERPSFPEAQGLRHLAFQVDNVEEVKRTSNPNTSLLNPFALMSLREKHLRSSKIDGLPLELYQ